ncbi:ABC transporter permease [Altererythrobacter sp. CAU 1778]
MSAERLSMLQAAMVVARRDFIAILFSRSFLFFLLGPLFPAIVFLMSGGLGAVAADSANDTRIALQMPSEDIAKIRVAHEKIEAELGARRVPHFYIFDPGEGADPIDTDAMLADPSGKYGATLTGTLDEPVLTGTNERLDAWRGLVAMHLALARGGGDVSYPALETQTRSFSGASQRDSRKSTAQLSMTLLFLLMMLLAGMVLSNLVEEKANKIIEILAAALPMDAVFLGKLFAMLAVSLVGIAVWFAAVGVYIGVFGEFGGVRQTLMGLPEPGVGWPMFCIFFVVYFSMGYLLIGSIFLAIGALASTVREVQTLSMPVTMLQLFIFFFASFALVDGARLFEMIAILFPLSSPFAMTARAAQEASLWPHALALLYQTLWVALFIRWGSGLFKRRVMHSGPPGAKRRRFWQRRAKAPEPA